MGAGVLLSKASNVAYENGLSGLEFACGIPGTIGGAVKMDAGANGEEIKDIVISTKYLSFNTMEVVEIDNTHHEFAYRHSRFSNNKDIIISSKLKLNKGNKEEIKAKMDANNKVRKEKQPLNYPSAGSVFKRGKDFITAKLIDECGLKGYNVGDAYVSDLHSGFIINKGNATAKDVVQLIEYIKAKVFEKFGKEIELEIEIIGED